MKRPKKYIRTGQKHRILIKGEWVEAELLTEDRSEAIERQKGGRRLGMAKRKAAAEGRLVEPTIQRKH